MSGLLLDLRYALRTLRRAPGFTAVAIITLALGIGANTSIFSFVNALLLRNLPVRAPEELVWLGIPYSDGRWSDTHSYRLYEVLRDGDSPFEGFAAQSGASVSLTAGESSERVSVAVVSGEFFDLLGVRTIAGRPLSPDDDTEDSEPSVVLSHRYWQSRFGGDPALIDGKVLLAGQPFTVVGVAPPEFHGTNVEYPSDLWVPISHVGLLRQSNFDWRNAGYHWVQIIGRISAGASREQAIAAAEVLFRQSVEEYLDSGPWGTPELRGRYAEEHISLEPVTAVSPYAHKNYRESLGMIAGAVGFLLLIACANVANLLLARGVRRGHELAVRMASGASRWRLIRQLLVEGVVLAIAGGSLGALLSWHFSDSIVPLLSERIVVDAAPDQRIFVFTLSICLISVLLFALFPAVQASRIHLAPALKGAGILSGNRRSLGARGWFIASQFALCLPLLVGAGLLIRTVDNLFLQDVGFERSQRIQAWIDPGGNGYGSEQSIRFFNDLVGRLAGQAGFESIGLSHAGTLGRSGWQRSLYSGTPDEAEPKPVNIAYSEISEGYFQTLELPLLAGRDFTAHDNTSAPKVVILNRTLARELFSDENPVGGMVRSAANKPPDFEVVGVVADSKYENLRDPVRPIAYFPFRQHPFSTSGAIPMSVYVRTPLDVGTASAAIREQVRQLDRQLPLFDVRTLDEQIESLMRGERMMSTLLTTFGLLALILTAVGLYGVIAFDVNRRTREVGLRMALGALRRDILALVFSRAIPWVAGGIAVGLAAAAALTRLLEKNLFELSPLDPATYAFALLFLIACAAVANYVPASRAARVEPMAALRHE